MMQFIQKHIEWLAVILIVAILGGSLPFKFTGAPITVHIFDVVGQFLGMDFFRSTGGYIIGVVEAAACILLLIPASRAVGAAITASTMMGAIIFHLFSPLGVTVRWIENSVMQEDGTLFYTAVLAFVCAIWLMLRRKKELLVFITSNSRK